MYSKTSNSSLNQKFTNFKVRMQEVLVPKNIDLFVSGIQISDYPKKKEIYIRPPKGNLM